MLSGVSSDTPPSNAIDTDAVVVYISNILQAMLQKQTQGPLLLDKEKMTRFATDPVAQVIYITADETTAGNIHKELTINIGSFLLSISVGLTTNWLVSNWITFAR